MNSIPTVLALLAYSASVFAAQDQAIPSFKKIRLTDQFWAEGANFGDFNRDGHNDVVYGPFWFEGPDFRNRHEVYPAKQSFKRKGANGEEQTVPGFEGALGTKNAYSDNFFAFVHDFNRDEWPDILVVSFPGIETAWYENPKNKDGHWNRHVVFEVTDNESPTFADLTGDGKPELICQTSKAGLGQIGYATPHWDDPTKLWTFHPITPADKRWHKYTHGLGFGDVNGDGRNDILEMAGWWEQPNSLSGDPVWKFHRFDFAPGHGSAQMHAYDVDGDGDNDVITSLAAHSYGLAWYEHVKENGAISFKRHLITGKTPAETKHGVVFSQLHAVDLIDMDGDGLKDIITGKRFWAHGPSGDDEPNAPAVLYWFKLVRGQNGAIDYVPNLIDSDSGIGTQVVAGRVNKDDRPDIVVGNKKGAFVFLQQRTTAN